MDVVNWIIISEACWFDLTFVHRLHSRWYTIIVLLVLGVMLTEAWGIIIPTFKKQLKKLKPLTSSDDPISCNKCGDNMSLGYRMSFNCRKESKCRCGISSDCCCGGKITSKTYICKETCGIRQVHMKHCPHHNESYPCFSIHPPNWCGFWEQINKHLEDKKMHFSY